MPRVIIRKRDDRASSTVSVVVGVQGNEEHLSIKREEATDISDAAYECLMNSHEADYMSLVAPSLNEVIDTVKRQSGRPTNKEIAERKRIANTGQSNIA